ncbi:hypothetical protein Tco_0815405, partial [Tanacetum coccineum]
MNKLRSTSTSFILFDREVTKIIGKSVFTLNDLFADNRDQVSYELYDMAFQRWNDIHKVRVDFLVSYLVMALMVKTEENARFSLKLRKLIADHLDREKLKSKKVKLEAVGYHSVLEHPRCLLVVKVVECYLILQRRVWNPPRRNCIAQRLALSFFLRDTLVIMHMLKSFQTSGVRLVGMISRIVSALVEPAPVVVEADSLAIEVDRFLNVQEGLYVN